MRVPLSIRDLYQERFSEYEALGKRVIEFLRPKLDLNWHFIDRLKSLESYAQKIETGRCSDPRAMEDYYACTIVVPNSSAVDAAEAIVLAHCDLVERRPRDPKVTKSNPDSFKFDDLRLYVCIKQDPALPPSPLTKLKFEVQIKTFLLHAWAIATHDLTYKTDGVRWGKERVAFQIRAMLEHAEISIKEVEKLSASASLQRSSARMDELQDMIRFLRGTWEPASLPRNIKSLAESVQQVCDLAQISMEELRQALEADIARGQGLRSVNLSPYGIIIQALLNHQQKKVLDLLRSDREGKKVFLPSEVMLPEGVDVAMLRRAAVLSH